MSKTLKTENAGIFAENAPPASEPAPADAAFDTQMAVAREIMRRRKAALRDLAE